MPLPTNRTNATNMADIHPGDHNTISSTVNGLSDTVNALFTSLGATSNAAAAAQTDVDVTQFNLAIAGLGIVVHGSAASTARPARGLAQYVWVGSVAPTNATNNDIWINTAAT